MKIRLAPLLMLCVPLVLAAESEWPSKGDTVYVAASFKKLSAASPVAGAEMSYDMPACAALIITKANSKKLVWTTKDKVGGTEKLEGLWVNRMHKDKAECDAQYTKDGEPHATRSGTTFRLESGDKK